MNDRFKQSNKYIKWFVKGEIVYRDDDVVRSRKTAIHSVCLELIKDCGCQ